MRKFVILFALFISIANVNAQVNPAFTCHVHDTTTIFNVGIPIGTHIATDNGLEYVCIYACPSGKKLSSKHDLNPYFNWINPPFPTIPEQFWEIDNNNNLYPPYNNVKLGDQSNVTGEYYESALTIFPGTNGAGGYKSVDFMFPGTTGNGFTIADSRVYGTIDGYGLYDRYSNIPLIETRYETNQDIINVFYGNALESDGNTLTSLNAHIFNGPIWLNYHLTKKDTSGMVLTKDYGTNQLTWTPVTGLGVTVPQYWMPDTHGNLKADSYAVVTGNDPDNIAEDCGLTMYPNSNGVAARIKLGSNYGLYFSDLSDEAKIGSSIRDYFSDAHLIQAIVKNGSEYTEFGDGLRMMGDGQVHLIHTPATVQKTTSVLVRDPADSSISQVPLSGLFKSVKIATSHDTIGITTSVFVNKEGANVNGWVYLPHATNDITGREITICQMQDGGSTAETDLVVKVSDTGAKIFGDGGSSGVSSFKLNIGTPSNSGVYHYRLQQIPCITLVCLGTSGWLITSSNFEINRAE